jgi:hypothetical protein
VVNVVTALKGKAINRLVRNSVGNRPPNSLIRREYFKKNTEKTFKIAENKI